MNDIEKKIFEAGKLHPISKSSETILEAFEKKHPHRIQKKFIFIPALSTLLASATAVAVIFALNPRPIHIEGQTNGFDDGSTVLTSVVSDISLNHFYRPAVPAQSRLFAKAIDQDDFQKAAADIDQAYNSYAYYDVHRDGFNYSFESTSFKYDDVNYHYQLSVNNTQVYLKDNISEIKTRGTFEGLIRVDDNCYPCEIVAKVNRNNVSTAFNYRINTYYYSLSTDTLNQRTKITHKTYIDEELAETNSVDLNYNKNIFIASFDNDNVVTGVDKERSFTHKEKENTISVEYVKRSESENIHLNNIKLSVSTDRARHHTYSYDGFDDVVI